MESLVEIKVDPGLLTVIFKGDVTLVEATTTKKMVVQALTSSMKPQGVILDMLKIGHVYSPALGRLLGLNRLVPTVFVLTQLHMNLFIDLGLVPTLQCCFSVADAVAALKGPRNEKLL